MTAPARSSAEGGTLLPEAALALERLDAWLDAHAEEADPFCWQDVEERFRRRKAFAEVAIYLYSAEPLGGAPLPHLRRLVLERTNDHRYAELIRREPRQVLLYAAATIYADYCGELGEHSRRAVDAALEEPTAWAVERMPHRLMDLWNVCAVTGRPTRGLDPAALVRLGSLGHPPDPARASLSEAYAFTHHLLFLHNFGVAAGPFPVPDVGIDSTRVIEGLVLRFLAEDNTDIVAELLLVGLFAGQIEPDVLRHGLTWLLAAADPSGYVRGPGASSSAASAWRSSYHTTLVVGSLLRYVLAHGSCVQPVGEVDPHDAEMLGRALKACSAYELPLAVTLLMQVAGTATAARFSAAFDAGVDFVRRQRSDNDMYGLWTDERHFARERDPSFDAEVAVPIDLLCRQLLDALS